MLVVKRIEFDAAHRLPFHPGACRHLHGHRWVVELGVSGEVKPDTGMVLDFAELRTFLNGVKDRLDHKFLNAIIVNPTAENIAHYIRDGFYAYDWGDARLEFIRVWETKDSYVELRDA